MAAVESVAGTPPIQPPRQSGGSRSASHAGADADLTLAQHAEETLGPLDCLVPVAALHEGPAADELLGLGKGSVDDGELAVLEGDLGALGRGGDTAGGDDDARFGGSLHERAHLLVQVGGRGLG